MRVYVSGPMTGKPELNFPAFHTASAWLRAKGLQVVNPAELTTNPDATWEECMRVDLQALCTCHAIALLPGWEASKGAQLELHVAERLKMTVWKLPGAVLDPDLSGAVSLPIAA